MIKEIPMYTAICDGCGKDSNEGAEYSAWNDQGFAFECAQEDNWIEHEHNHYCPDCYHYDDEDELILYTAPYPKSDT
jgi:hypothetical protein